MRVGRKYFSYLLSLHIFLNFKNIKVIIHFTLSCTLSTTDYYWHWIQFPKKKLYKQQFILSHICKINLLHLVMN
jgi:hypothetical protein